MVLVISRSVVGDAHLEGPTVAKRHESDPLGSLGSSGCQLVAMSLAMEHPFLHHLGTKWHGFQINSGYFPLAPAFPLINSQIFIIHPLLPDSESWRMSHLSAEFRSQVLKPC